MRLRFVSPLFFCLLLGAAAEARADFEDETALREYAVLRSPRLSGVMDDLMPVEKVSAYEWAGVYKGDVWTGLSGSLRRSKSVVYLGSIDITLSVAGESAFDLPGATLFLHVQNTHGGEPNRYLGTAQGIDNIEVGTHTTKILQLWYQQQWLDDRVSLLTGLYDVNTEFYATPSSALFLHPSFGIGAEMAQTGENGPSIFPTTSLAARLRVQYAEHGYAQIAAMDGVPGDPQHPRGTQIHLRERDGLLWVAEAGRAEEGAKIGVGVWQYSRKFDALSESGAADRRSNRGAYALWERRLIDEAPSLSAFARAGVADAGINALSSSATVGLSGGGWNGRRPDDQFGVGIAYARYGSKYRALEPDTPRSEIAYELSYRFQMRGYALQPDLMWIDRDGDGDLLAGLRVEASF